MPPDTRIVGLYLIIGGNGDIWLNLEQSSIQALVLDFKPFLFAISSRNTK